jgi:hypothetical protein
MDFNKTFIFTRSIEYIHKEHALFIYRGEWLTSHIKHAHNKHIDMIISIYKLCLYLPIKYVYEDRQTKCLLYLFSRCLDKKHGTKLGIFICKIIGVNIFVIIDCSYDILMTDNIVLKMSPKDVYGVVYVKAARLHFS